MLRVTTWRTPHQWKHLLCMTTRIDGSGLGMKIACPCNWCGCRTIRYDTAHLEPVCTRCIGLGRAYIYYGGAETLEDHERLDRIYNNKYVDWREVG